MTMMRATVFQGGPMGVLRAVLAALLAMAFIGLVVLLAAFLTAAVLVVVGVAAMGGLAYWAYRKLRGRSRKKAEDDVIDAHQGPQGWTVDGDRS